MTLDPILDCYKSAKAPERDGEIKFSKFIETIKSPEFFPQIKDIRDCLIIGDDKEYDRLKRELEAVTVSGTCSGPRKNAVAENRFTHNGLLQVDIDGKDNVGWSIKALTDYFKAAPQCIGSNISPGGDGVKGYVRIDPDHHRECFEIVRQSFAAAGIAIDESVKDEARLCFVSYDPDAWCDVERVECFTPDTIIPKSKPKQGIILRGNADAELTLSDLDAMLKAIPRQSYAEWLKTCSGAWNHFGEDATAIIAKHWPEESPGEYAEKFKNRETRIGIGSVVMVAKDHGWTMPKRITETRKAAAQVAAAVPAGGSTSTAFQPEDIFYDQPGGKYMIRVGMNYHVHAKIGPVATGLTRHMAPNFSDPKELVRAVNAAIKARELDGGIQWSGSIAGHAQGMAADHEGKPILILSEAQTPTPTPGDCPLITSILEQVFSKPEALITVMSWLAGRTLAVREHIHIPSPMLVMAGEVNSGKSLLAWIISQLLGGRTANPYSAWSGGIMWNDDLIGSELLLVDDCTGNTDIRARRAFGAAFKEAMYPHAVQLRKRHSSSISVRPVWACVVCCNDTPESLQIIPPIDADMSDKIILLHCTGLSLPHDTSTPDGKRELQAAIRRELPAFAHQLSEWVTPDEFRDSRSGVLAWRDPDLVDSVDANSPARRIEQLIETAITHMGIWHDLPRQFTAMEIESRLTDNGSPVRDQAKQVFTWHGACGSALSRLAAKGGNLVTLGTYDSDRKINRYVITP
jgi:hypothetical protein